MKKVQILMSTYNGERYLAQQLDSILSQTYSELSILVRDDGSSDGTVDILEDYAKRYNNVRYYGFADQDDVWLEEKVERAIEMLEQERDMPLLYCSDTYITDEKLNIVKKDNKNPRVSFGNALVQNICTGCTAVINKKLRNIIIETNPKKIVMHDWWLYLSAEIYGKVCYDNNAYIKYRQHGDNTHGAKISQIQIWKYRFKQLAAKRGYIYEQLEEVMKWYPNMKKKDYDMLLTVLESKKNLKNRIRLILKREIYKNAVVEDIVYRVAVILGKL